MVDESTLTEYYDQGYFDGVRATLHQLAGLIDQGCSAEEIDAWIDSRFLELEFAESVGDSNDA